MAGDLALIRPVTPLAIDYVLTHATGFGGYYYAAQVWSRARG